MRLRNKRNNAIVSSAADGRAAALPALAPAVADAVAVPAQLLDRLDWAGARAGSLAAAASQGCQGA